MVTPQLKERFASLGVPMIPLAAGARMFVDEVRGAERALHRQDPQVGDVGEQVERDHDRRAERDTGAEVVRDRDGRQLTVVLNGLRPDALREAGDRSHIIIFLIDSKQTLFSGGEIVNIGIMEVRRIADQNQHQYENGMLRIARLMHMM